jgi:heme/copper-type cytochrome/quinol oxidase subunit 4
MTTTTNGQIERARGIVAAFVGLLAITALEVGLVNLPVDRAARVTALVGLAMTKVLVMLMVFMRLGRESRLLRGAALVPLVLAPAFAVALMLDAVFRVTLR